MDGFWRYRPVTDRWLTEQLGLYEIPDYFQEHDFPYEKRPFAKEVPFADHLILVRLMGGWSLSWTGGEADNYTSNEEADFIFYQSNGTLGFRRDLIKPRLEPYIDHGYDSFTIVLDNTPWGMPITPVNGNFGNTAPPQYPSHFYWGVKNLIQEIRQEFGTTVAENLRFRMGTEYQGTKRFSGTQAQYERLYDFASDAVRDELSNVDFFPFNMAGPAITNVLNNHNINMFEVGDHCANGNNVTGGIGAPFTNFPMSLYFNPAWINGELRRAKPKDFADTRIATWDELENLQPTLQFKRSIHEFGVLNSEDGLKTDEPGARGAAQRFEVIVRLLEGGMDELAHWDTLDRIPAAGANPQYLLMTGETWIYTIFEHFKDAEMYSLPVAATSALGTTYKALLMKSPTQTAVLISSFNEDRTIHETVNCTVVVPDNLIAPSSPIDLFTIIYDITNSPHDWLREEFANAGILKPDYVAHPHTPARVRFMADTPGYDYVRNNWTTVKDKMVDSLTLNSYTDTATVLPNGDLELSFPITSPSLRLIVLE